jgi:hypothetical protein
MAIAAVVLVVLPGLLVERSGGQALTAQLSRTSTVLPADSVVNGLSCPSVTFCVAAGWFGYAAAGGGSKTWAEKVSGMRTSLMRTPNPTGASQSEFNGVSCPSSTFCVGVGDAENSNGVDRALAETYQKGKWVIDKLPSTGDAAQLVGVSCSTAKFCLAFGQNDFTSKALTFVARDVNGTWSLLSLTLKERRAIVFSGVSCVAGGTCLLVGRAGGQSAYRYSKTTLTAVQLPKISHSVLVAVSCVSSIHCTAVGVAGSRPLVSLAERLGRHGWTALPSLGSVAPVAVSCFASGHCYVLSLDQVASYDGKSWSTTKIPGLRSIFGALACASASYCVAGGQTLTGQQSGIIDVLSGSKWITVAG